MTLTLDAKESSMEMFIGTIVAKGTEDKTCGIFNTEKEVRDYLDREIEARGRDGLVFTVKRLNTKLITEYTM